MARDENVKNSQEWLQNAEALRVVFEQLAATAQSLASTQANALEIVAKQKQEAEGQLQATMRQLEAEGKLTDAATARKAVRAQERQILSQQLRELLQSDAQREQALANHQEELAKLQVRHERLRGLHGATSQEVRAAAEAIETKEAKIASIKSEQLNLTEKQRQALAAVYGQQIQLIDAQEKFGETTQNTMSTLMGLDNKWKGTFTGSMYDLAKSAIKAKGEMFGLKTIGQELSTQLSSVASLGNVLGSSLMKAQVSTIKMVHTINQSEVAFQRSTGAGQKMAQVMTQAYDDREIQKMAGSMQELSQASAALYSNYRAFSNVNAEVQTQLSRTAMAANRVGVSFDDFSTVVEKSTRIFGDRATEAMNRLYNSAIAIGETPARMTRNYIQSLDTLAQYSGPRAIRVFQELSSMSKATGIEMQRLVSVANQFDTFESAADSTAKLNAILGGPYLNSVQMLNASESERLRLLRGSIDATNRNWESLGRFERKAFAAAAGFQNLATAAAFFQGNMAEVDRLTRKQEEQTAAQEKLISSAANLVPIVDRLARIAERYGATIAEKVLPFLDKFMVLLERVGPIGIIAGKAAMGFAANMASVAFQANAATAAQTRFVTGLGAMKMGLRAAVGPMLIMGGAIGILYAAINKEGSPKTYDLPATMARGLNQMAFGAAEGSKSLRRLSGDLNAMHGPVNALDTEKITGFGQAVGQMGFALKNLPKENVVAVTEVIRESRQAGALGPAATARAAQAFAAQGASVARAGRAAAAGGGGGGTAPTPNRGVYVTDRVQFQIGGYVFEKTVEDIANNIIQSKARGG